MNNIFIVIWTDVDFEVIPFTSYYTSLELAKEAIQEDINECHKDIEVKLERVALLDRWYFINKITGTYKVMELGPKQ